MNNKIINIVFISSLVLVFCPVLLQAERRNSQENSPIKVYLPRQIEIKNDTITLGEVAIIRGDESLVDKAERIVLGRFAMPGQKVAINKAMIVSRLVCSGIENSKFSLTGAEKVTITRQNLVIKSDEFIELARKFIKENSPPGSIIQAKPVRIPKELIVPGEVKALQLVPSLTRTNSPNLVKVQITVLDGNKRIGTSEMAFRLKFNSRRLVAVTELRKGTPLTAANTRIEKIAANYPEPANWVPPYGLVAKHRILANSAIRSNMIGTPKPLLSEIIIKRNQNVVMRYERPGILITAMGQAMEDARVGDIIKVRNIDSRRIVFAKVNENGTVEPVY